MSERTPTTQEHWERYADELLGRAERAEARVKELEETAGLAHCPHCHRNVCGDRCTDHDDECPARATEGEAPSKSVKPLVHRRLKIQRRSKEVEGE